MEQKGELAGGGGARPGLANTGSEDAMATTVSASSPQPAAAPASSTCAGRAGSRLVHGGDMAARAQAAARPMRRPAGAGRQRRAPDAP